MIYYVSKLNCMRIIAAHLVAFTDAK